MHVKSIQFLFLIGIWALSSCADITFEEPTVQPPLAEIGVTKRDGSVAEVFARLQSGEPAQSTSLFIQALPHQFCPS